VNKKGITLIELIIVMIIIAIGGALMVPGIGSWLPNYRLKSATRDIVSMMRVAQMKAVSTNTEYRVSFNPGAGTYILQRNSGGVFFDEGASQALPTGILISAISFPGNNAEFNPNSTSSTGSLTLVNTKGSTRTISLTTATGRVSVE
jgi:prepilin-type N-terminal cleavage/methylation domain-containing protein